MWYLKENFQFEQSIYLGEVVKDKNAKYGPKLEYMTFFFQDFCLQKKIDTIFYPLKVWDLFYFFLFFENWLIHFSGPYPKKQRLYQFVNQPNGQS